MKDTDFNSQLNHPDFRLEGFIAAGGMGAVIAAEEVQTGRSVALKVMHPEALESQEAVNRFFIEAQVLAQLEHPNIVPMHALRTDLEGRPFYTMKKVHGRTLQEIISGLKKGEPDVVREYPLSRLLTVFMKVCDAIGFAHARLIVHRDLKPANIMVGEFGEVLVMDWGLAKLLGQQEEVPESGIEFDGDAEGAMTASGLIDFGSGLTMAGAVMGTPQYMAPEQAEGRINDIDARSDVFALGAILYSVLTLHPPVSGRNLKDLLSRVASGDFAPPTAFNSSRRDEELDVVVKPDFRLRHCPGQKIPGALSDIVMKAMAVEPTRRYQSVEAFQEDIEAWLRGYSTSAQRPSLFRQIGLMIARNKAAVIVAVLLHVVAAGFLLRVAEQRRTAEAALVELRTALPLFEEDARALVAEGKFDAALERLDQCLTMMPGRASLHRMRGDVLQAKNRFAEAVEAFEEAAKLDPNHAETGANLELTRELSQVVEMEGRLERRHLDKLAKLMKSQGRFAEERAVRGALANLDAELLVRVKAAREFLKGRGQPNDIVNRIGVSPYGWRKGIWINLESTQITSVEPLRDLPVDQFNLDYNPGITSLEPLRGMKLRALFLKDSKVSDLSPLQGMPLDHLDLFQGAVASLVPLKGIPLKELRCGRTGINDLGPLAGMPLELLEITDCREVKDLTPLAKSARLQIFRATGSGITNLAALAGMPLRQIDLVGLGTLDLSPLKGMPVEILNIGECPVSDIGALAGLPLKKLFVSGTLVADLSPLRGMKLETLGVERSNISDISPLYGMPLRWLRINNTRVGDLSPLRGMLLEELALDITLIQTLDALRGMPLRILSLNRTPITSVEPLSGAPLKTLELAGCNYLADVSALGNCMQLETLILPHPPRGMPHNLNLDALRALPFLKRLGYGTVDGRPTSGSSLTDAATFWQSYDRWRRTMTFK